MRYIFFLIGLSFALSVRAQGDLYPPVESPTNNVSHVKYDVADDQLAQNGFTIAFSATLDELKNHPVLAGIRNTADDVLWRVGADEHGKVYITRFITVGGTYNWNVTFWNPESVDYFNHPATDRIFFMIIQEPGELRVHVGMPNGKFDCMYLDYGLENTAVQNPPSNSEIDGLHFIPILQHTAYWKQPLCRTDAFSYAKEHFYNVSQPTWSSLIGNDNTELKQDVHDDDAARIGHCYTNSEGIADPTNPAARTGTGVAMKAETSDTSNRAYVVYPNPNNGRIHVRFAEGFTETEEIQLKLYDLQLRPETSGNFQLLPGEKEILWDISAQAANLFTGVYLLEVKSRHGIFTTRLAMNCACNAR